MTRRYTGFLLVMLGAALGLGCGGKSQSSTRQLDKTPVHSSTFSPRQATDQKGNPAEQLWWIYRVNGGAPVTADNEGMTMSCQFGDFTYILDPVDGTREGDTTGKISGSTQGQSVSGSYKFELDDETTHDQTATLVTKEHFVMTMNLAVQGQSANIAMDLVQVPQVPWEWFLDRPELDTLEVGYTTSQNISQRVSGTVTADVAGNKQSKPVDATATSTDTWTITGRQESTLVNGVAYSDIVTVQRDTMTPDLSGTGSPKPATYTYDVARGVGFVRAVGLVQFSGQPLPLELVQTNLVQ
jgi:hypothetical protein